MQVTQHAMVIIYRVFGQFCTIGYKLTEKINNGDRLCQTSQFSLFMSRRWFCGQYRDDRKNVNAVLCGKWSLLAGIGEEMWLPVQVEWAAKTVCSQKLKLERYA